jgi:hypothetical protein
MVPTDLLQRRNEMRSTGKPLLVATTLALSAMAVTPVATAQDVPDVGISAKVRAVPSKAGTKRNPRGVMIKAHAKVSTEPGFERPIVTDVELLVGPGLIWNFDDAATCSKRVLDRKGPRGCPKRSIVGEATGTAYADNVVTHPDVVLINGGPKRHLAYVTLYHPALVKETIVIKVTKLSGKWTQRESFTVPESLRIVAGVPIQVTSIDMTVGGKPYAKEYTASTFCPKGGWKYRATAHFLFSTDETTSETIDGSIPCTK